jgi:hypothetical protein
VPEKLLQCILDSAPGSFGSPGDAALRDRLAGDTGNGIDVLREVHAVGVGDPGHLAFARAEVRNDVT